MSFIGNRIVVLMLAVALTACGGGGGGSGDGSDGGGGPGAMAFSPAKRENVAPGLVYLTPDVEVAASSAEAFPVSATGAERLLVNGVEVEAGKAEVHAGDRLNLAIKAPDAFEKTHTATLRVADKTLEYTLKTGTSKLRFERNRARKALVFEWDDLDVTRYRLLHNADGNSGYTPVLEVGGNTARAELPVTITQLDWERGMFAVEACLSPDVSCVMLPGHEVALKQPQSLDMIDMIKPIAVENEETDDDAFGSRLAMSGNGKVLAVGVGSDKGETDDNAGAVHIYRRSESGWQEDAVITEPDSTVAATFGVGNGMDAIALNEDGTVLAVTQSFGTVSGRTMVYRRVDNAWHRDEEIFRREFSGQVISSAALTAGGDRVVTGGGSALNVYDRNSDGSWGFQNLFTVSEESLGRRIRLSGDGRVVAVSSPEEVSEQGAVYVFFDGDGDGIYEAFDAPTRIIGENSSANDNFGSGLALSADGALLVVGAEGEDAALDDPSSNGDNTPLMNSGAVYVFQRDRDANNWHQIAYLKAPNGDRLEGFGSATALSADGHWLGVCAYGESGRGTGVHAADSNAMNDKDGASTFGAAYLYERTSETEWTFRRYIKASTNAASDEYLGFCDSQLAMSSDGSAIAVGAFDHDGAGTGVNAADPADTSIPNAGAVFVY